MLFIPTSVIREIVVIPSKKPMSEKQKAQSTSEVKKSKTEGATSQTPNSPNTPLKAPVSPKESQNTTKPAPPVSPSSTEVDKPSPKPMGSPSVTSVTNDVHTSPEDKDESKPQGNVRYPKTFSTFILWMSIPSVVRDVYKANPDDVRQYGYDPCDPVFTLLLEVRTLKEFAAVYKVDACTLTQWRKRKDFQQQLDTLLRENVLRWRADVDDAFVKKLIKDGDSARYKLYYQIFCDYADRQEITGKGGEPITVDNAKSELLDRINSIVTALAEKSGTGTDK